MNNSSIIFDNNSSLIEHLDDAQDFNPELHSTSIKLEEFSIIEQQITGASSDLSANSSDDHLNASVIIIDNSDDNESQMEIDQEENQIDIARLPISVSPHEESVIFLHEYIIID